MNHSYSTEKYCHFRNNNGHYWDTLLVFSYAAQHKSLKNGKIMIVPLLPAINKPERQTPKLLLADF